MLEQISKLIHEELWMGWAQNIIKTEPNLSQERKGRWEKECFMPYEQLSESMKDLDRQFAQKIINLIESNNER